MRRYDRDSPDRISDFRAPGHRVRQRGFSGYSYGLRTPWLDEAEPSAPRLNERYLGYGALRRGFGGYQYSLESGDREPGSGPLGRPR